MTFYRNISYKMTDSQINSLDLKAKDEVSNRNFIVPAYSAPLRGTEPGEQGTAFKARPIKHWRKQLTPRLDANGNALSGVNGRRAGILGYMGVPGSTSILGGANSCSSAPSACTKSSTVLSDNILRPVDDRNNDATAVKIYDSANNRTICIACNPQNNIIKPATTILSKTYYADRKAYLQSRCLLYDQRLSGNRLAGVTYVDASGNELLPNGTNGVEQRASENCLSLSCGTAAPIIYKPNNAQYATQGAVDSSSRIARLKYNTINKNNSMTAPFGSAGANANALYNGSGETPYFLKSKNNNAPCTFKRKGSKNAECFNQDTRVYNSVPCQTNVYTAIGTGPSNTPTRDGTYELNVDTIDKLNTLRGCTKFIGTLRISLDAEMDWSIFDCLQEVTGSLWFDSNTVITTIPSTSFPALTTIGDEFNINTCTNLTSILGFNSLINVGGKFFIYSNPNLQTINGFAALKTIGAIWSGSSLSINNNGTNAPIISSVTTTVSGFLALTPLSGINGNVTISGISVSKLTKILTATDSAIDSANGTNSYTKTSTVVSS